MRKIIFIQGQFTQFDTPFYNSIYENFDITVIYTDMRNNKSFDFEIGTDVIWSNISSHKYKFILTSRIIYILKFVFSKKPDYIIISGWYPPLMFILSLIFKLFNYNIAIRSDKIINENQSITKNLFYKFYLSLFKYLMPVGKQAAEFFKMINSKNEKKILLFPYCVDTNWIKFKNSIYIQNRENLLEILNFKTSDCILISAIKFNEREDPITLINTFIRLRKSNINYKLILLGDGPLKTKIINILNDLNKDDRDSIFMPGYVNYDSLIKYFSISNLYIHPAKYEPFGVSVQEALICGLYAIVSDQVGSRFDFITSGLNGDIYNAGNELDLYNKITIWENSIFNNNLNINFIKNSGEIYTYEKTKISFLEKFI